MDNQLCGECIHKIECALRNATVRFKEIVDNPIPRSKLQLNRWQWNVFQDCLIMKELYKTSGKWDY